MNDIVFLYDQIVELTARLQTFSAMNDFDSGSGDADEDINNMIVPLAKRDLLMLAATSRNICESSKLQKKMKEIRLTQSLFIPQGKSPFICDAPNHIHLYHCLSRILHANFIDILRTPFDYLMLFKNEMREQIMAHILNREQSQYQLLEPTVFMATEKDGGTIVTLPRIIAAVRDFLNALNDELSAKNVFVSQTLRSL
jgi:hypothetical protein